MADGGGAVWDAKYVYWYPRPENGIRDSGIDRAWEPFVPTPTFPAYPSGSAGYAGGADRIAGFRPEHVQIGNGRVDGIGFDARVEVVEYLGDEQLVHGLGILACGVLARTSTHSPRTMRRMQTG